MRRIRHLDPTPRWKYWVFALVTVADAMVTVLSLGFYEVQWRSHLLFSDWMDSK